MAVGDFHWSGILSGWRKTDRTENMLLVGDIMPSEGKPTVGWRSDRQTKNIRRTEDTKALSSAQNGPSPGDPFTPDRGHADHFFSFSRAASAKAAFTSSCFS